MIFKKTLNKYQTKLVIRLFKRGEKISQWICFPKKGVKKLVNSNGGNVVRRMRVRRRAIFPGRVRNVRYGRD